MGQRFPFTVFGGGGSGSSASRDSTNKIHKATGLVSNTPFVVYGNGTELGRATVDILGNATVTLATAPAAGVVISYGQVFPGGTIPTPPVVTPSYPRLLIFFGGQSLMEYIFLRGGPAKSSAQYMAADLRTLAGYSSTRAINTYNQSKSVHDATSQNGTDWSIRLENTASGGSSLYAGDQAGVLNAYGEKGNYWYNAPGVDSSAATGNSLDNNSGGTDPTPGPLARKEKERMLALIALGYEIASYMWSQGTSNMTTDPSELALYKSLLPFHFANVRSWAGKPNLAIFFHRLHRHQTASDEGAENIRQVQRDIVLADPNTHVAAEEYPQRVAIARQLTGATITLDSNVITLADTGDLAINKRVVGPGIPEGAYVSAITVNAQITLARRVKGVIVAANATASASNATIYRGDDVHLYPGVPGQEPLDFNGGTEYDPLQGSNLMVRQSARRIAHVLSLPNAPTASQGPYVSGASFTRGSTTLRVKVTHVAGTDLSPVTDTVGWRVVHDGTAATVTDAVKIDATTIDLTINRALNPAAGGAGVTVQYAWGAMLRSVPSQFIYDNASPFPLPIQARNAISATVIESTNVLTTGTATGFSSSTSGSSYTGTNQNLGAVPSSGRRHALVGVEFSAASTARNISSVTVAGKAATLISGTTRQQNNSGNTQSTVSAWYIVELLGTDPVSGDVVVTTSATVQRCAITTRPVFGLPSASVTAFHSSFVGSATTTDPLTATINTATNGLAFGLVTMQGGTEQRYGSASLATATAQTGLSVTATSAQGDNTWTGLTETFDGVIGTVTSNASILNLVSFAPV